MTSAPLSSSDYQLALDRINRSPLASLREFATKRKVVQKNEETSIPSTVGTSDTGQP